MDRWDLLIVAVAAYVAVMTLVRLMSARRSETVNQFLQQIAEFQRKKKKKTKSKDNRDAA